MTKSLLHALRSQIRNCHKCVNLCSSRLQAVPGDGSHDAKALFIGLAPGRNGADITGIPFTKDKTGRLLRENIKKMGLSAKEVYLTNLVKCNPKDRKGRNRNPTSKEIKNCRLFLEEEIQLVNPKIVVTLGVRATEVILGEKIGSMKRYNARVLKNERGQIFPMFHPGFVVRGAYDRKNYEKDFQKLKGMIVAH